MGSVTKPASYKIRQC